MSDELKKCPKKWGYSMDVSSPHQPPVLQRFSEMSFEQLQQSMLDMCRRNEHHPIRITGGSISRELEKDLKMGELNSMVSVKIFSDEPKACGSVDHLREGVSIHESFEDMADSLAESRAKLASAESALRLAEADLEIEQHHSKSLIDVLIACGIAVPDAKHPRDIERGPSGVANVAGFKGGKRNRITVFCQNDD